MNKGHGVCIIASYRLVLALGEDFNMTQTTSFSPAFSTLVPLSDFFSQFKMATSSSWSYVLSHSLPTRRRSIPLYLK